jgi:hypothetical protein
LKLSKAPSPRASRKWSTSPAKAEATFCECEFDYNQFRPHFAQVGLPPAKARLLAAGANPRYQLSGLPFLVRNA